MTNNKNSRKILYIPLFHFIAILVMLLVNFSFSGNISKAQIILPFAQEKMFSTQNPINTFEALPPALPGDKYDLVFMKLELELDPLVHYVKGKVKFFIVPHEDADSISLQLHDSLQVENVSYHGNFLNYSRPGIHALIINFPEILLEGELDSLEIIYQGDPPNYLGENSLFTGFHLGKPTLWTLSEPYGAFTWFPCKITLDDKIDSTDISILFPLGYKAATIGMPVKSDTLGLWVKSLWKHRYPVASYLIGVAVGDYQTYIEEAPTKYGTIKIYNYVYSGDINQQQNTTAGLFPVYVLYSELFGPYPFLEEKYGHLECGMGGGMEHQTLTFAGPFNHHILSHELAHSWFGNKITTGSWTDIWLNEGLASYATGLTYQYMFNGFYWKKWKTETIAAVCQQPNGSVIVDDTTLPERIFDARLSYHKASLVLHMIRFLIGDSAFFYALQNYADDPMLSYGYARTPDLIGHFETSSGIDLTEFTTQWLYGEGFPSYTIDWGISGTDTLELSIWQQTSSPSVTFFNMPVEIGVKNAINDTLIRLNPSFSGQQFQIPLTFTPDSLVFDPNLWLISANNQVNGIKDELYETLKIYPNPATSFFYIPVTFPLPSQISIFDLSGRIIRQYRLIQRFVPVDDLEAGIYIITLSDGKNTTHAKLIKH